MPKTEDLEVLKYLYMPGIVVMTGYMFSIDDPDDNCYVANNKNILGLNKTFQALAIKRSTIRSEDDTVLNELEIDLDNADLIFKANMMNGKYNNRRCKIYLLFANNLATSISGSMLVFEGFTDEPKGDENWITLQVKPFNILERGYPNRIFQPNCNWTFCSASCGLSLIDYQSETALTSDSDGRILTCPHGKAIEYFTPGFVEVLSGPFINYYRPISSNDTLSVTVRVPFPSSILSGTSIRIQKLCSRNPDACINTFDNYDNYGGFPHCPKSPIL